MKNSTKKIFFLTLIPALLMTACQVGSSASAKASTSTAPSASVAASTSPVASQSTSPSVASESASASESTSVSTSTAVDLTPYALADAMGKIATSQASINESDFTITSYGTATDYVSVYKKDAANNQAVQTTYTSWGLTTVETVGTYADLSGKVLKTSVNDYGTNYSTIEDTAAIGGFAFEQFFGWSFSQKFYGLDGFAAGIYGLGSATSASSFTDKTDDTAYGYSYGYQVDTSSYLTAEVTFSLDSQDAMTAFSLDIKDYGSDFVKNDTTGVITPGENYSESTYIGTQKVGTRVQDTAIDFSKYFYTDMTLSYKTGETTMTDLSTAEVGTSYTVSLTDPTAGSLATLGLDAPTVTVTSGDADKVNITVDTYNSGISLTFSAAGSYAFKIATLKVTKTFTATVSEAKAKSLIVMQIQDQGKENTDNNELFSLSSPISNDTVTCYTDDSFNFMVSFLPIVAPQAYSAILVDASGNPITDANYGFSISNDVTFAGDITNWTGSMVTDVSGTAGTAYVKISSTQDGVTLSVTKTINFVTRGTFADRVAPTFIYKTGQTTGPIKYQLVFSSLVADTTTATTYTGTATLTDKLIDNSSETASFTAVLDATTKIYTITFTHVSGSLTYLKSMTLDRYDNAMMIDVADNSYSYYYYNVTNAIAGAWTAVIDSATYSVSFAMEGEATLMKNSDTESSYNTYVYSLTHQTNGTYQLTMKANSSSGSNVMFFRLTDTASYVSADFSTVYINVYATSDATTGVLTAFTLQSADN